MAETKDLTGQRFGKLVAIRPLEEKHPTRRGVLWLCQCDCGEKTKAMSADLVSGNSTTCGCSRRGGFPPGFNHLYRTTIKVAKKRGLEFSLSIHQFYDIVTQDCSYCGSPPSNNHTVWTYLNGERQNYGTFAYTGIDRIDNTKGYIPGNCVPCCKYCNRIKSDQTLEEFSDWITRVYHGLQKWTIPPEKTN